MNLTAQTVISLANQSLSDMGNGGELSLAQMDAISNAFEKVLSSKKDKSELVFKLDDKPVQMGQDFRVEVEFPDNESMTLVVTHEGIIIDTFKDGEENMTASLTFDEMAGQVNNGIF